MKNDPFEGFDGVELVTPDAEPFAGFEGVEMVAGPAPEEIEQPDPNDPATKLTKMLADPEGQARLKSLAEKLGTTPEDPQFQARMKEPLGFRAYTTLSQLATTGDVDEADTLDERGRPKGLGLTAAIQQFGGAAGGMLRRRRDAEMSRIAAGQELEVGDLTFSPEERAKMPALTAEESVAAQQLHSIRKYKKIEDMTRKEQDATVPKELLDLVNQNDTPENPMDAKTRASAIYEAARSGAMTREQTRRSAAEELAIREEVTGKADGVLGTLGNLAAKGMPTVGYGNLFLVGTTAGAAAVSGQNKTTELLSADIDPDTGEVLKEGTDYKSARLQGYGYGLFEARTERDLGKVLGIAFKGLDKLTGGYIGKVFSKGADAIAMKLAKTPIGRGIAEFAKGVRRVAGLSALENPGTELAEEDVQQWAADVFARRPSDTTTTTYAKNVLNEGTGQLEQVPIEPGSEEEQAAKLDIFNNGDKSSYVEAGTRQMSIGEKTAEFNDKFYTWDNMAALAEGFALQYALTLGGGALHAVKSKEARGNVDRALLAADFTTADLIRMTDEQKAKAFDGFYGAEANRAEFAETFKDAGEMLSQAARYVQEAGAWDKLGKGMKPTFVTDIAGEVQNGATAIDDEASGLSVEQTISLDGATFTVRDRDGKLNERTFATVEEAQAGAEEMSQLKQGREIDMNRRARVASRVANVFAPGRTVVLVQSEADMERATAEEYANEGSTLGGYVPGQKGLTTPKGTLIVNVAAAEGFDDLVSTIKHETGHSVADESGLTTLLKVRSVASIAQELQKVGAIPPGAEGLSEFTKGVETVRARYAQNGVKLTDAGAVEEVLSIMSEGMTPVMRRRLGDGLINLLGGKNKEARDMQDARRIIANIMYSGKPADVTRYGTEDAWNQPPPAFTGDPMAPDAGNEAPAPAGEAATPAPATETPPAAAPAAEAVPPVVPDAKPAEAPAPVAKMVFPTEDAMLEYVGTHPEETAGWTEANFEIVPAPAPANDDGAPIAPTSDAGQGEAVPPKTEEKPAEQTTASIPVMITKKMESDLRAKGFAQADIDKMTPQAAHAAHAALSADKPAEAPRNDGSLFPETEIPFNLEGAEQEDAARVAAEKKAEEDRLAEEQRKKDAAPVLPGIDNKEVQDADSKRGAEEVAGGEQAGGAEKTGGGNAEGRDGAGENRQPEIGNDAGSDLALEPQVARQSAEVEFEKVPERNQYAEIPGVSTAQGKRMYLIQGKWGDGNTFHVSPTHHGKVLTGMGALLRTKGQPSTHSGVRIIGGGKPPQGSENWGVAEWSTHNQSLVKQFTEGAKPAPSAPSVPQSGTTPAEVPKAEVPKAEETKKPEPPAPAPKMKFASEEEMLRYVAARPEETANWTGDEFEIVPVDVAPADAPPPEVKPDAAPVEEAFVPPKVKVGENKIAYKRRVDALRAEWDAAHPPKQAQSISVQPGLSQSESAPESAKDTEEDAEMRVNIETSLRVDAIPNDVYIENPALAVMDVELPAYEARKASATRTADSKERQAYSTPPPLAAIGAAALAGAGGGNADTVTVIEPTAGNGGLIAVLGLSEGDKILANELDEGRAKRLRETFLDATVTQGDYAAEAYQNAIVEAGKSGPRAFLMNPPFGPTDESGYKLEHKIALKTIESAVPGDTLFFIGAAPGRDAMTMLPGALAGVYTSGAFAKFHRELNRQGWTANLHFIADGALYRKMGASFPVEVLLMEKTDGKVPNQHMPMRDLPARYSTWEQIRAAVAELYDQDPASLGERVAADLDLFGAADQAREEANKNAKASSDRVNAAREKDGSASPRYRLSQDIELGLVTPETGLKLNPFMLTVNGKMWDKEFGGRVHNPDQLAAHLLTLPPEIAEARIKVADAIVKHLAANPANNFQPGIGFVSMGPALREAFAARWNADRPSEVEAEGDRAQVNYSTLSAVPVASPMKMPIELAGGMSTALNDFADRHPEGIDAFVAEKMRRPMTEKELDGSQIDTLGLAIEKIDDRTGFIVGSQCVAGETRIYDPRTGTHCAIRDLCEKGEPITVLSLTPNGLVPTPAGIPFLKGVDDLYRVTMDDGRSITVTREHRFLTPVGWQALGDGLRAGHFLASAEGHPACSLGCAPSTLPEGDPRSPDTVQDCRANCRRGRCSCDEQPQSEADSAPAFAPLPACAPEHILGDCGEDDSGLSQECTRVGRSHDPRARSNSSPSESRAPLPTCTPTSEHEREALTQTPQSEPPSRHSSVSPRPESDETQVGQSAGDASRSTLLVSDVSHPTPEGPVEQNTDSFPSPAPHREDACPRDTAQQHAASVQVKASLSGFPLEYHTGWRRIVAIEFVRTDEFFDMVVPGAANYTAEGFINHNTGAGKGRVMASVIDYHALNGRIPIFMTAQAKLFTDIWRDLTAVGAERRIKPLVLNDYKAPKNEDEEDDDAFAMPVFFSPVQRNSALSEMELPEGANALFLTYSQVQNPTQSTRRKIDLILRLLNSGRGALVLDEAHLAAGADSNRGAILREFVSLANAGVVYSSATFAKRGENMDLYRRAGYSLFFKNDDEMTQALTIGDVPFQQYLAARLTERGFYVRHELDYEGVVFDKMTTIDTLNTPQERTALSQHEEHIADVYNQVVRTVMRFGALVRSINDRIQRGAPQAQMDGAAFMYSLHNTASFIYTALKAETVANAAVAALRAGQAPVVTLYNTNEALLREIGVGQVADVGRYLTRIAQRAVSIIMPDGSTASILTAGGFNELVTLVKEPEAHLLRDAADALVRQSNSAADFLREQNVPASPIDRVREVVQNAGFNFSEVTGRDLMVQNGVVVRRVKPNPDTVVHQFNNSVIREVVYNEAGERIGTISKPNTVMLLNSSGSTGLSAQASREFLNQAQRVMFVLQPSWDINEMMQMFGRVNRKNQISKPIYHLVFTSAAGEQRNAAILMSKLRSLSANTSGVSKAGYGEAAEDALDFMNAFGDRALAELAAEHNPVVASINALRPSTAIRPATSISQFLPVREQEQFIGQIQAKVAALQDNAREAGLHDLEAGDIGRVPLTVEQLLSNTEMRAYEVPVVGKTKILTAAEAIDHADAWREKHPTLLADAREKIDAAIAATSNPWLQRIYGDTAQVLEHVMDGIGLVFKSQAEDKSNRWFIPLEVHLPPSGTAQTASDWRVKVSFNNIRGVTSIPLSIFGEKLLSVAERASGTAYNNNLTRKENRTLIAGDVAQALIGNIVASGANGAAQIVRARPLDGNFSSFVLMMPRGTTVSSARQIASSRLVDVTDIRQIAQLPQGGFLSIDAGRVKVTPVYSTSSGDMIGAEMGFRIATPNRAKSKEITVAQIIRAAGQQGRLKDPPDSRGYVGGSYMALELANKTLADLAALHPALQATQIVTDEAKVGGADASASAAPRFRIARTKERGAVPSNMNDIELRRYLVSSLGYGQAEVANLTHSEMVDLVAESVAYFAPKARFDDFTAPRYRIAEPVFFSQLRRTLEAKMPNRMTVMALRGMLDPSKSGIKAEEIEWTGLKEFLDGKNPGDYVTKAEALEATKDVEIQEVVKGGADSNALRDMEEAKRQLAEAEAAIPWATDRQKTEARYYVRNPDKGEPLAIKYLERDQRTALETWARAWVRGQSAEASWQATEKRADTKFSQYQLAGGENYRELLLTLPDNAERWRTEYNAAWDAKEAAEKAFYANPTPATMKAADTARALEFELARNPPKNSSFKSSHFSEPNILVHVRFNERTAANGDRTLFLEEVQSDWMQAGRDKGFAGQARKAFSVFLKGSRSMSYATEAEALAHVERAKEFFPDAEVRVETLREPAGSAREIGMVPDAPFKDTSKGWARLALKRMLRFASESGSDNWREATKPVSVREQVEHHLGRELATVTPLKIMDAAMLPTLKYDQVRREIIKSIPIDVMNVLSRNGVSADEFLRKPDVVGNTLPVNDRATVARGLARALELVGARLRAEMKLSLSGKATGGNDESLFAVVADQLNPRVIVGMLAPSRVYGVDGDLPYSGSSSASAGTKFPLSTSDYARKSGEPSSAELAVFLNRHEEMITGRLDKSNTYYPSFDRIAWTTGEMQAERYDLSKKIERVSYNDLTGQLMAWEVGAYGDPGRLPVLRETVPIEKSADYVGKEAAQKLIAAAPVNDVRSISGDDLRVGGEGMRTFYDQILPSIANDLGKKFGARVEDVRVGVAATGVGKPIRAIMREMFGESVTPQTATEDQARLANAAARESETATLPTVHSLPIPPAMTESVLQGQPRFRLSDPVRIGERRSQVQLENAENDPGFPILEHIRGGSHIIVPKNLVGKSKGEYDWFTENGGFKSFTLAEVRAFFRRPKGGSDHGNIDTLAGELGYTDTGEFADAFMQEVVRSRALYAAQKARREFRASLLIAFAERFPRKKDLSTIMGKAVASVYQTLPPDEKETLDKIGTFEGEEAVRDYILKNYDARVFLEMQETYEDLAGRDDPPPEILDEGTLARPEPINEEGDTAPTYQQTKARLAALAATLHAQPLKGAAPITDENAAEYVREALNAGGPEFLRDEARAMVARRLTGQRDTALNKYETAVMLWYQTDLDTRTQETDLEAREHMAINDTAALKGVDMLRDRIHAETLDYLNAIRLYGSVAGQSLQALKMRVDQGFNIVKIYRQAVEDNGDMPLTRAQYEKLKARVDALAKAWNDYVDAAGLPEGEADLEAKIADLETKLAAAKSHHDTLKGEVETMEKKRSELEAEYAKQSAGAFDLSETKAQLEARIAELEKEIAFRTALYQEVDELQAKVAALQAQIDAQDVEYAGVDPAMLADLQDQIAELEKQYVQKRAEYEKAQADLKTALERLARVRKLIEKLAKGTKAKIVRRRAILDEASNLYGVFKTEMERAQVERLTARWRGANPAGKAVLATAITRDLIRGLQSMGDESVAGRQLAKLGLAHPFLWARAFAQSQQLVFTRAGARTPDGRLLTWAERSDRALFEQDQLMREHPLFDILVRKGGLSWMDLTADPQSFDEQQTPIGPLLRKMLPRWTGVGGYTALLEVSNNHYAGMSNMLRFAAAMQLYGHWNVAKGETPSESDVKAIVSTVDIFGARGNLTSERARSFVKFAGHFLYSPRLTISNVQFFKRMAGFAIDPATSGKAKAMIATEYLRLAGTYAVISIVARLISKLFSDDPDEQRFQFRAGHTAFGQLMFGQRRLDISGGAAMWARSVAQIFGWGDKLNTETGLTEKEWRDRENVDAFAVGRLVRSKLDPWTGMLVDLAYGKTYDGQAAGPRAKPNFPAYAWRYPNMLKGVAPVPLSVQSFADLLRGDVEQGVAPLRNPLLIIDSLGAQFLGTGASSLPINADLAQEVEGGSTGRAEELKKLTGQQDRILGDKKMRPELKELRSQRIQSKIDSLRGL